MPTVVAKLREIGRYIKANSDDDTDDTEEEKEKEDK